MVSFLPRALPIARDEFARMFQACIPPSGWFPHIGVANSGGPDSTCLLFLLHRHLASLEKEKGSSPTEVMSFTIDHALQPCSAEMARKSASVAEKLGIQHLSTRIPWGEGLYPPFPEPGAPIEAIARKARYHALFHLLLQANVHVVAFGHHSDDQLETALMRMGRGTSLLGARGIWPCRRWGMGMGTKEGSPYGWTGKEGMRRWIVRPLLPVTKDRILATCEENGLEYVTDPTNFQPDLTLRNALRQRIELQDEVASAQNSEKLPQELREQLDDIDQALQKLSVVPVTLDSGKGQLQSALQQIISDADDIDTRVDTLLKRCRGPSPPGTFLISQHAIANVRDPLVRRAIILRILRYASFFPWGSLRADANRRTRSLTQIIDKIWDPRPLSEPRDRFIAGGGVIWTPVMYDATGKIRTAIKLVEVPEDSDSSFGWIASRQPPFNKRNPDHPHFRAHAGADPTDAIVRFLRRREVQTVAPIYEFLWDCRFLVTFRVDMMPLELQQALLSGSARLNILPCTEWSLPMITRNDRTGKIVEILHVPTLEDNAPLNKILKKLGGGRRVPSLSKDKVTPYANWIRMDFLRSLDSA